MDERTSVPVKPVEYHELKAVAHIPLALFVMLSFPPEAKPLRRSSAASSALPRVDGKGERNADGPALYPEQLLRQQEIFRASFELLDEALGTGEVSRRSLLPSRSKWGRCCSPTLPTRRRRRCANSTQQRQHGGNSLPGGVECAAHGHDWPAYATRPGMLPPIL